MARNGPPMVGFPLGPSSLFFFFLFAALRALGCMSCREYRPIDRHMACSTITVILCALADCLLQNSRRFEKSGRRVRRMEKPNARRKKNDNALLRRLVAMSSLRRMEPTRRRLRPCPAMRRACVRNCRRSAMLLAKGRLCSKATTRRPTASISCRLTATTPCIPTMRQPRTLREAKCISSVSRRPCRAQSTLEADTSPEVDVLSNGYH
jgi:hypothetical protein